MVIVIVRSVNPTRTASQFGSLLRQLRTDAGMTQERLADLARLGERTVRGLETGERADPRVGTVRQLADALDLDPADRVALFAAAGHSGPPVAVTPAVDDRLVSAAGRLAYWVRARWQREVELRQVQDPLPLPVRWRPVADELVDSWTNIRRGDGSAPLDLAGRLDQVVDVYRRVPSGRLVVLGRAGSGKTILTLRFVLDMLKTRTASAPVPVVLGLGSWHPATTPLRDWIIAQLERDHPDLATPGPGGVTLAAELVESDLVLPVLDGFDELPAGLHRAALRALNATTLPLVLTSRVAEYAEAVAGTDVLTAAAGVELCDLTVDDLAAYLPRTTRKTEAWQPVLAALPSSPLASVLTTPLMVVLARTIYSDTPDHDPAELLGFPTPEAIEDHLLGTYVPTVYRHDEDADRAERWLGFLARGLTGLGTHDLAWWQVAATVPMWCRMLVTGLLVGLVMGGTDLVVEGLLLWQVSGYALAFATVLGVIAGLAFAVVLSRVAALEPSRVRVRLRGRVRRRRRFGAGFAGGFLLGVGYGVVLEVLRWLILDAGRGPLVGAVNAVFFGVVFGLGAGFMFWLVSAFEAPLDVTSVESPAGLLRANRTTVLTQLSLFGPPLAVVMPLTGWLVTQGLQALPPSLRLGMTFSWSPLFALVIALLSGIGGAAAYILTLTAWGQWFVFARLWLPLTGRLPWRLPAFLEDAYRRGVLRRAGAVYQFRHARLEAQLGRPQPRHAPRPPTGRVRGAST